MKKFLCLVLITFPLIAFAQASGGQISRRGTSRTPVHTTKKSNKGGVVSSQKVYPQRDELFVGDERLQPKGVLNSSITEINYYVLPSPDFNGHLLERNRTRKQIALRQHSCESNSITDDEQWLKDNGLQLRGERVGVGMKIGNLSVYRRIRSSSYHILLLHVPFGDITKVVVTDEQETVFFAAYDFENFRKSPKRNKADELSGDQHVIDVIIENGIMYVAHGGTTYASTYGNQTGYISAISLLNNEILWTSLPLTNNCKIALVGNSLITGYGFTEEPDYLFVLDKYSGQRVQKIALKNGPEYIIAKENSLLVRTYSYNYVFSIQ